MIFMVFCRYCGMANKDSELKCSNCGKPLSLLSNEPLKSEDLKIKNPAKTTNDYLNSNKRLNSDNNHQNIRESPIKSKYINNQYNMDQKNEYTNTDNNYNRNISNYTNPNKDYKNIPNYNSNNLNNDNNYVNNLNHSNNNLNYRNMGQNHPNYPHDRQNLDNNNEIYDNRQVGYSKSPPNLYPDKSYKNSLEYEKKNYIEWDVIIATAFITIILSAIFNRILPSIGLLLSLLISLIYILIATTNKSSLFISIPLTLIMVATISAYFSL
jgi:hypothetical protein